MMAAPFEIRLVAMWHDEHSIALAREMIALRSEVKKMVPRAYSVQI